MTICRRISRNPADARRLTQGLAALACAMFAHAAIAGDFSWNATGTSPALNYGGISVSTQYAPPRPAAGGPGPQAISRVHAKLSYKSNVLVQTSLCWNGTERCVPVSGSSFNTNAFNGLDAGKPMYLVHTAPGKGPLPQPIFVRGEVIVWFTQ